MEASSPRVLSFLKNKRISLPKKPAFEKKKELKKCKKCLIRPVFLHQCCKRCVKKQCKFIINTKETKIQCTNHARSGFNFCRKHGGKHMCRICGCRKLTNAKELCKNHFILVEQKILSKIIADCIDIICLQS